LHDLNRFFIRCILSLECQLVSFLCLFHLFNRFDHFSICQSSILHLFFDTFSGILDLLSHFMSHPGLQLSLFLHKSLFLCLCILELGLQFLDLHRLIQVCLFQRFDSISLHDKARCLGTRVNQNVIILFHILHLHLEGTGAVADSGAVRFTTLD
jgi:hypothetical protein